MHEDAFTVIIPAHNEGQVIERCLVTASADTVSSDVMQVIVAANGCTDNTAEIARQTGPAITVIEQEIGSKPLAMNAARSLARHPVILFLDADVQCSFQSLKAVARALREPGVMAASPSLRVDVSRSNRLVRSYYSVWMKLPYITDRLVGSGCFGLSQAALERLGEFPEIVGDDIYIRSIFSYEERRNVSEDDDGAPVSSTVSPPRTLGDQIRVEARRRTGNEQVDQLLAKNQQAINHRGGNGLGNVLNTRKLGASWFDIMTYLAAKSAVIFRVKYAALRGRKPKWERDFAAREA